MAKQLVIVVHGVGVKEAGVSADLLATALDETPEQNSQLTRSKVARARLRPHSSDDFHLREFAEYNVGGKRQVFPARIRRYRHNDDTSGQLLQERVVADFYWGDISNIASGLPGLLLGILKTILGLSHIIRENALSVFPGSHWYPWLMRRVANGAALTIHGPIAAINLFLFVGIFSHAAAGWIGLTQQGGDIWLTAILGAMVGLYLMWQSAVYLTRFLGGWLIVTAVIFLLMWAALPEGSGGLKATGLFISDDAIRTYVCSGAEDPAACAASVSGIYLQGLRLISLMNFCWIIVMAAALIMSIAEAIRSMRHQHTSPPSILSATIALMMLLWIIMIGAVWATIAATPGEWIPASIPLEPVLGMLTYCLFSLVLIGLAEGIVFLRARSWGSHFDPAKYIDPDNPNVARKFAQKNRLIVSFAAIWILRLFLILIILATVDTSMRIGLFDPGFNALPNRIETRVSAGFGTALAILTAIAGIAVAAGQAQLRAGLGIAIDVITWLNDHSWKSQEAGTERTRTMFEKVIPQFIAGYMPAKEQGYWRRNRIKRRLEVLATQLIRDERPDALTIISHSQGTVVAIDVLNSLGRQWLALMAKGATMQLITMGSPYTHVHRHYFPASFPQVASMVELNQSAKGGILMAWENIFRIDDFVGTYIDPTGTWPREHPVPANGHTYYWVDENVFPIIKECVL